MKVLLLSTRPLGAAEIDRVLLNGLHPTAVDVCPSINLALSRLDAFTPDLIIVNLPEPDASDATRRLRERGVDVPTMVVAPAGGDADAEGVPRVRMSQSQGDEVARHGGTSGTGAADADLDVLTRDDRNGVSDAPVIEARLTDAVLAEARDELDQLARGSVPDALDAETRWLLYEVASIGHVSTTPHGDILAANDIAAQLLGHFSHDALEAVGAMPRPLLDVAGPFARRPSRFELCLQHGADGPLHWIVGLALPQGGVPATVTWFLIDVSEQRLQTRRARFLRRMESLTHVLSAATAECTTLVDTGSRALTTARDRLSGDVDIEQAIQALSRTQAVLGQLAGFARRRARRPALRDLRALLDQVSPVLVHVTGDDVIWTMDTGETPLFASFDAAEFEQCLTALVTQAREALPLGGQIRLRLEAETLEASVEDNHGTRPEVAMTLELQGYGLQPLTIPPAVQTQIMRLGAELATVTSDHLTTRVVLRMPRVFVTA
jgi:two-component system cell cycle sensor histidine kinase/response regulator CckA